MLLGLVDHAPDLFLEEAALVVGDDDAVQLASGLVGRREVGDAVGVNMTSTCRATRRAG